MQTITGTQLRTWRKRHGWSRELLAVLTEKSHQTICNAEQQDHDPIPEPLKEIIEQLIPGAKIEIEIEIEHPIK